MTVTEAPHPVPLTPMLSLDAPVRYLWPLDRQERGPMGTRALNAVQREGIETIADLLSNTWQDIADIPNAGAGVVAEVRRVLAAQGLSLPDAANPAAPPAAAESCGPAVGSVEITRRAGITYRQLDYWRRRGFLVPAPGLTGRNGSQGFAREWPLAELEVACLMGRLTAAGLPPEIAVKVARHPGSRCEIAPGIIVEIKPEAAP